MSYQDQIRARAKELSSDGCSHCPDFYLDCCLEHDVHIRTGRTLRGVPVTRADAAARFRRCIQDRSSLRWLNPLSWWRWAAVRYLGPQPIRTLLSQEEDDWYTTRAEP